MEGPAHAVLLLCMNPLIRWMPALGSPGALRCAAEDAGSGPQGNWQLLEVVQFLSVVAYAPDWLFF